MAGDEFNKVHLISVWALKQEKCGVHGSRVYTASVCNHVNPIFFIETGIEFRPYKSTGRYKK
jgi:hypothetical protein